MNWKEKIYKALVYRSIAFLFVLGASLIVTGSLQVSTFISILDLVFKTIGYVCFEIFWERLRLGETDEEKKGQL
jgi:uncharacterized membrane protein